MGVLLCEMAQRPVTASEIPGHCHPITRYTRQRNHRNVANTFVITVILALSTDSKISEYHACKL